MKLPQPTPVVYTIDWDKVKSFKDLTTVMTALDFQITDQYKNFKTLEPFVKQVQHP